MKDILRNAMFLLILVGFVTCDDEEIVGRPFPRLKTMPVTKISSNGAVFNAEITFRGNFEVISYGFVWGLMENPTIINDDRVIISENIKTGQFSADISATLKEGVKYYVRSFIETEDYTVYGKNVEFLSLGSQIHEITGVSPETIAYGDTLKISGKRFSRIISNHQVRLAGFECSFINLNDSLISIKIPYSNIPLESELIVYLFGNPVIADKKIKLKELKIEDISPASGKAYDTLYLTNNLGFLAGYTTVKFNNITATSARISKNQLKVVVPPGIENPATISLDLGVQNDNFQEFEYFKASVNGISPTVISWEDEIEISGSNFSKYDPNVKIDVLSSAYGKTTGIITSKSNDYIKFHFPPDIYDITSYNVKLTINGHEYLIAEPITFNKPVIENVIPEIVTFGDEVTVTGTNFNPNSVFVKFENAVVKGEIIAPNTVVAKVPEFTAPGSGSIQIRVSGRENKYYTTSLLSDPKEITFLPPKINSISPSYVQDLGDEITIDGENFSTNPAITKVYWDGAEVSLTYVSNNKLQFKISDVHNAKVFISDPITVKVGAQEVISNSDLIFENRGKWKYIDGWGSNLDINFSIADKIYYFLPYTSGSRTGLVRDLSNNTIDNPAITEHSFSERYEVISFRNGNEIYLGGGSDTYYGTTTTDEFWMYNLENRTWNRKSNIPFQTKNTSCFELDGIFYCTSSVDNHLYFYNVISDEWTSKNSIPYVTATTSSDQVATFVYKDEAYLIRSSVMYKYDPNEDNWTTYLQSSNLAGVGKVISVGEFMVMRVNYTGYIYNFENNTSVKLEYPYGSFSDMWVGDDALIYFTLGGNYDHTSRLNSKYY